MRMLYIMIISSNYCINHVFYIHFRENIHQVGSILFETNFIITQLAMFDLLLRFDHHRRPSSETECSVVTAR